MPGNRRHRDMKSGRKIRGVLYSVQFVPINIYVLLAGSAQQSMLTSAGDVAPAKTGCAESIMVHGLLMSQWRVIPNSNGHGEQRVFQG